MNTLFTPLRVGALQLPNRLVMAPLTRNRSPNHTPNALTAAYYAQRASAGLIISEAVAISPMAVGYADVPGLWTDAQAQAWRGVTDAVHAAGGRIVAQLWHVGRVSHTSLLPGGADPVSASAIAAETKTVLLDKANGNKPSFVPTSTPRALFEGEISGIVADYAAATRAALAAGFDGVEIHAANGYLIEQFLKTNANLRTDGYGGSVANRAKLLVEVVQAVCEAAQTADAGYQRGHSRVGLRLSPVTPANGIHDDAPQALYAHVAQALAGFDLAYVHMIEGSTGAEREIADRPFDYGAFKAAYRSHGGHAAWMVNNALDLELAEKALANGDDLACFGRPFISNPDLVARLQNGLPLTPADRKTFYGGAEQGYTDYPAYSA